MDFLLGIIGLGFIVLLALGLNKTERFFKKSVNRAFDSLQASSERKTHQKHLEESGQTDKRQKL